MRSPASYSGKTVRVVGVYRYGFEWSEVYSLHCPDAGSMWVEWSGDSLCSGRPGASKPRFPRSGATVGLIVRGRLQGPGRFGHLDGFDFQLDVDCIERMELLDKRSYQPGDLTPDMRRKIEKFEKRFAAPGGEVPGGGGARHSSIGVPAPAPFSRWNRPGVSVKRSGWRACSLP